MSRQRTIFGGLVFALGILCAGDLPAQIWLGWDDVTATNISASPSVGANDIEEKDFATVDFDLDGDIDLICVRKLPFTTFGNRRNVIFENVFGVLTDVTDTLAPGMMIPDNARDVAVGNFNGDIWPDFAIANAGNAGSNGQQPRIFINLGDDVGGNWLGFVEEPARLPFLSAPSGAEPNFCAVAAGDLNGNGVDDLYFVDYQNTLEDILLINDGTGFFTNQTSLVPTSVTTSGFGLRAELIDVNGDGWRDILKNSAGSLSIAYNNGSGGFVVSQSPSVSAMYNFAAGDLDGDGLIDIFAVQDPQDQWLWNTSAPGATPITWQNVPITTSPLTTGFGGSVHIDDIDGDGDNDVVIADTDTDVPGCTRRLAFLRNNGGATPSIMDPYPANQWTVAHHQGVFDFAIADFNGDGAHDIFIGHCAGNDLYFQTTNIPGLLPPNQFSCPQVGLDVVLSWSNPDSYDDIVVRRDGLTIATLAGSATSFTDPIPGSGTRSYSLIATLGPDESSPASCVVVVSTVSPVLGLLCDQIGEDVQLDWTNQAPVGGGIYSGIRLERNGLVVASLPGTASSYLDLGPPLGLTSYQVIAEFGGEEAEPGLCTLSILPTNLTDLILGFEADDNGATDSVAALTNALGDNGIFSIVVEVQNVSDIAGQGFFLADFERVWVELGTWPNNKILSQAEGTALADYVSGGGQIYVSGGDFFCFNAETALHALTGIDTLACPDGNGLIQDVTGIVTANCDLLNFTPGPIPYTGETSFVDQLAPLTTGVETLRAAGSSYACGVLNTLPGGGSVISQSVEMGGIGAPHDKKDLVERYINCFGSTGGPLAPVAEFLGSPLSGTAPLTVNFTDLSAGTVTGWLWDFGDLGMSNAQNPSHTFTAAGSYTVDLTTTGPGGADTETKVGYISVGEPAPTANFTAVPTSGDAPLDVQFADTSTGVVTGRTWVFGDGGFSNSVAPLHTYTSAGTYTVSLTVSGPGGSDNLTLTNLITVNTVAGPGFSRGDVNQDGSVDIGDAIGTLSYIFGGIVPGNCLDALDMADTGTLDIAGPIYLLGYLFSNGPAPAAPFGACGEDPTADSIPCDAPPCP